MHLELCWNNSAARRCQILLRAVIMLPTLYSVKCLRPFTTHEFVLQPTFPWHAGAWAPANVKWMAWPGMRLHSVGRTDAHGTRPLSALALKLGEFSWSQLVVKTSKAFQHQKAVAERVCTPNSCTLSHLHSNDRCILRRLAYA